TPEEYEEALGQIDEAAGYLAKIAAYLLVLARADAGQVKLQPLLFQLHLPRIGPSEHEKVRGNLSHVACGFIDLSERLFVLFRCAPASAQKGTRPLARDGADDGERRAKLMRGVGG